MRSEEGGRDWKLKSGAMSTCSTDKLFFFFFFEPVRLYQP